MTEYINVEFVILLFTFQFKGTKMESNLKVDEFSENEKENTENFVVSSPGRNKRPRRAKARNALKRDD